MDVKEQGMNLLWYRVLYRNRRKQTTLLKKAMNLFVEQCKRSEKALEEQRWLQN